MRVVYSPMDAVALARKHPERQVVFFAVGFETTAPANAMAVAQAARLGLENFSMLVSHVLVPPAIRAVLDSPANRVQGFLAAGHVCTITGMDEYRPIAEQYRVPIVVTGFEPVDILQGVLMCVRATGSRPARGREPVRPQRAARGQPRRPCGRLPRSSRRCRGSGAASARFPHSGLALREAYAAVRRRAALRRGGNHGRRAGRVHRRRGAARPQEPHDCPAFGIRCTPERPLGAPMVSSEGACAAYYRYRRREREEGERDGRRSVSSCRADNDAGLRLSPCVSPDADVHERLHLNCPCR